MASVEKSEERHKMKILGFIVMVLLLVELVRIENKIANLSYKFNDLVYHACTAD